MNFFTYTQTHENLNKGISEITYNTLNLPLKEDIKSPVAEARNEYTYSAAGKKMKVVSRWNPAYSTNPIIGSGVNTGSLTSSKTTDYVGSFISENNVLKKILTDNGYYENGNYYFYIKNQSYKYTGKEPDMEHGLMQYDYEARQYDPAIGRFTTMNPIAEKYYAISPYAYCGNNPVRFVNPTGMWIVGTDGKPITYDEKNGWSANTSMDVQKVGSAMMRTPEGKKVFNDMTSTKYGITMNYKEGFHPENRDKLGEANIKFNEATKETIGVEINLFDGKIQENIAEYEMLNNGYSMENPTHKDILLTKQAPTLNERIGQVGTHEGTHATNPNAMAYRVGEVKAEQTAVAAETKAIQQTIRPIPINLSLIKINMP